MSILICELPVEQVCHFIFLTEYRSDSTTNATDYVSNTSCIRRLKRSKFTATGSLPTATFPMHDCQTAAIDPLTTSAVVNPIVGRTLDPTYAVRGTKRNHILRELYKIE